MFQKPQGTMEPSVEQVELGIDLLQRRPERP